MPEKCRTCKKEIYKWDVYFCSFKCFKLWRTSEKPKYKKPRHEDRGYIYCLGIHCGGKRFFSIDKKRIRLCKQCHDYNKYLRRDDTDIYQLGGRNNV